MVVKSRAAAEVLDQAICIPASASTGSTDFVEIHEFPNDNLPLVICIPGGGFVRCESGSMRGFCNELHHNGISTALIPYALTHPAFPEILLGIQDTITEIQSAMTRGIISHRDIVLLGFSAGAFPALLLGLNADLRAVGLNLTSVNVAGIVNLAGQPDRTRGWSRFDRVLLGRYANCDEYLIATSPVTHFHAGSPPVLSIYGDRDSIIVPDRIRELSEACASKSVQNDVLMIRDCGHDVLTTVTAKAVADWTKHLPVRGPQDFRLVETAG